MKPQPTKKDKIKMLNDIKQGKLSIDDLLRETLPCKIETWQEVLPDRQQVYNSSTGETLSLEDFKERTWKRNKEFNIAYVVIKSTGIPFAFCEKDVVM